MHWQSLGHAGSAELVAVGSRDVAKAQDFIDRCSAQVPHPVPPKAVGSYDEMLASDQIDAIYLPLPTGLSRTTSAVTLYQQYFRF